MLDAHTALVSADSRNEPKFRDVIRLLSEDVARRRTEETKPDPKTPS